MRVDLVIKNAKIFSSRGFCEGGVAVSEGKNSSDRKVYNPSSRRGNDRPSFQQTSYLSDYFCIDYMCF